MKKQLVYIQDSGHGWLEVPYAELVELGIQNDISSCSYIEGSNVYLEEDCDMWVYLNAVRDKNGEFEFREGQDYFSLYVDGRWVGRDWYSSYNPNATYRWAMSQTE